MTKKPNVLFIMTDQQRFDTIAELGNKEIYTPNFDRLVKRGTHFTNAYSSCPVCVPARYTIRTGCDPITTNYWDNCPPKEYQDSTRHVSDNTGDYLSTTMKKRGYKTWAAGKFHPLRYDEDLGWDLQFQTEEVMGTADQEESDAYFSWIKKEHPEFAFIEMLHGERTEMYYMPQMSPLPAELTVEAFVADRAVEQIQQEDDPPFFGFVSFIGPHPPCAPPIPFNRMYNPDNMSVPIKGDIEVDHLDDQIPCMNYAIWADDINDRWAQVIKARYYGEISYIDQCVGNILDAVESRDDAEDTVICFFADHGDHMGDHHAWQKESFFEASCKIPFIVSWPGRVDARASNSELVGLTDLFGIATSAAGGCETRDGIDLLSMLEGKCEPRRFIYGYWGTPGTKNFKIMIRDDQYKYIYFANGNREQFFDLQEDPNELVQLADQKLETKETLKNQILRHMKENILLHPAMENGTLKSFDYEPLYHWRAKQFNAARGIHDFPENPADILNIENQETK